MGLTDDEIFSQYKELVEAVGQEAFDDTEDRVLSQSALTSLQQLQLLARLRERLSPVEIPSHVKTQEEPEVNDHSYFLKKHGKGA